MRRSVIFPVLLAVSSQSLVAKSIFIGADEVRRSAKLHCMSRYPDDFTMQGACRRNAEDGANSVNEISRRFAGVRAMQQALRNCVSKYTEKGITDFAIAGGCARNNEEGFAEMER